MVEIEGIRTIFSISETSLIRILNWGGGMLCIEMLRKKQNLKIPPLLPSHTFTVQSNDVSKQDLKIYHGWFRHFNMT